MNKTVEYVATMNLVLIIAIIFILVVLFCSMILMIKSYKSSTHISEKVLTFIMFVLLLATFVYLGISFLMSGGRFLG